MAGAAMDLNFSFYLTLMKLNLHLTLAGVARLVRHPLVHGKVACLIPVRAHD